MARQATCFVAIMTLTILMVSPAAARSQAATGLQQWQSLNDQAMKAYQTGDYSKAISSAKQAVDLARRLFGNLDPKTLNNIGDLGLFYSLQGRNVEAERLYQEAVSGMRESQVFGPSHPSTLTFLTGLATLYSTQHRYTEAKPLFREALQARRKVLGSTHPDTLTTLDGLAFIYQAETRYDKAEPLYQEALQGRREVLGRRHPDTLTSLSNLALLYLRPGPLRRGGTTVSGGAAGEPRGARAPPS